MKVIYRHETALISLAILLIVILSGTACPPAEEVNNDDKVAQTEELYEFIPNEDYVAVGFAGLDNLLATNWGDKLIQINYNVELWSEKLGLDLTKFHDIAYAISTPADNSSEPDALIVMTTDLSEKEILDIIGEKSNYFDKENVLGRTQYITGEGFSFSFLEYGTVAIGTPRLVKDAIYRADGQGESFKKNPLWKEYEPYVGSEDDLWVGVNSFSQMMNEISEEAIYLRAFRKIDFVYFGVMADEGMGVRMIMRADDEEHARRLAKSLKRVKGFIRTILGLSGTFEADLSEEEIADLRKQLNMFLDNIDIESRGMNVIVSVRVPQDIMDYFVEIMMSAMSEMKETLPDRIETTGELPPQQDQ